MNQILWKPVPGYEGLYKINIDGKIVSLQKRNFGKEISKRIDRTGYWIVKLKNEIKYSSVYVHRVIALAFIDNPLNKSFVNHINGNKQDYNITNLEWVTASENMQHAFQHGLCHRFKSNNRAVIDRCNGKQYCSITEASEFYGISYSTLLGYLSGYRKNKTCLQYAA